MDTLQETENQNVVTKSLILAPFNSTLHKNENWKLAADLKIENDVMKICGKVKEAIRNYELNNNGEIDNGFLINLENQNSNNENNNKNSNANSSSKINSKVNSGITSKASLNSLNNDAYNKIKIGSFKNSNKNSNSNSNANLNNLKMNGSLEDENVNVNNINSNNNNINSNQLSRFTNSREYLLNNHNNIVIGKYCSFLFLTIIK